MATLKSDKVEIENVIRPGKVYRVDAASARE
jgi:hypothetical protein